MSEEDITDLLEEGREPIRQVDEDQILIDWQNRVEYYKKQYTNSMKQYLQLTDRMRDPKIQIRAWYNPNDKTYFYEQIVLDKERKTEFQSELESRLGIKNNKTKK